MAAIADLVHQSSTSTGTGDLTLSTLNGKRSFNDAFGTGGTDAFYYFVSHRSAAEWEVGTGHLSDADTLVRDTVLESSNSNSAVNFSAGTKDVCNDIPAGRQVLSAGLFSVKDFGAVGDGATDDTAAIQAAIDAADDFTASTLPSITGFISARVYFPAGNYLHTGLTSTKPHRFHGDGKSATFLKLADGSNTHFWTHALPGTVAGPTSGQHYFQQPIFQDMTWDCNKANQTGTCIGLNLPSTAWTITTTYAVGAIIDRMEIYNANGSGVSIGANRNFGIIKDTTIKGCAGKGIANNAYDWRMYNFDVGTCLYGYSQDAAGGATVWGANIYQNTERGVNIESGVNTYVWFTGCSIDLNGQYGAAVNGNSDQETFQVSFDQCRFNGNGNSADNTYPDILAQNCYGLTVSNCMFYAQGDNLPSYALQTSGGGPVFWTANHYRTSGGTQPWATALTNDFTKLQIAGDRQTQIRKGSNGGADIIGTTTNDDAPTGFVGEFVTANASTVAMVTATPKTITSISLTAGDWDVWGTFQSNPAGTTTQSYVRASVSTTDNTQDFNAITQLIISVAAGNGVIIPTPIKRVSIASTTTVYLVGEVAFSVSTLTGTARINARRAR